MWNRLRQVMSWDTFCLGCRVYSELLAAVGQISGPYVADTSLIENTFTLPEIAMPEHNLSILTFLSNGACNRVLDEGGLP